MTRRTVVCMGSSLAAEREMLARLEEMTSGAKREPHPVGGREPQPGKPPFSPASHQHLVDRMWTEPGSFVE